MNRVLVVAGLVAALLTATAVLLSPAPVSVAVAATPAPCVWDDELQRTLDELGEDPRDWVLVRADDGAAGKAYTTGMAAVDPEIGCEYVASVVYHEWMHLQQLRVYGDDFGRTELGTSRMEIVADCGAWLLGSTYTPYRQELLNEHGIGCTGVDLADARELIAHVGVTAIG